MNADGSIIAVADSNDGAVALLSTTDWQMRGITGQTPVPVGPGRRDAALAFDGRGRLLVGRTNDRVDVIDPASATISASMALPQFSGRTAAMAVGDSGIVIASGDLGLIAFEPDGQQVRWSTDISQPIPESCEWLALSESMQRVYCGSRLGERISVFDLADGAPIPAEEIGPLYGDGRDDRRERRRRYPDGHQSE